jgi:tetratricopeptide (TPR) repeat protein
MKKDNILFAIIGILSGLIIGFLGANQLNRSQNTFSNLPIQPTANSSLSSENSGQPAMPAVAAAVEKAEKNAGDFESQMKAGEMFARIKNFDKAIPYFEKANTIKPNDYQTLVILGNAYFDVKKWLDAEKMYEKALAIKSDDISVRTDYGITFVERDNPDYDRAIKEFETSLKINPKHEQTLFNLTLAYFKKGDVKSAQETKAKLPANSELAKKADELLLTK